MGSGEADAIRHVPHTLDAKHKCIVEGCRHEIAGDAVCKEHGGDPLLDMEFDEFGNETAETYVDPAVLAVWEPWD